MSGRVKKKARSGSVFRCSAGSGSVLNEYGSETLVLSILVSYLQKEGTENVRKCKINYTI